MQSEIFSRAPNGFATIVFTFGVCVCVCVCPAAQTFGSLPLSFYRARTASGDIPHSLFLCLDGANPTGLSMSPSASVLIIGIAAPLWE